MGSAFIPCVVVCLSFGARVASADPVAEWDFGAEETARLMPHGGVHRDQPGPRPPVFPDFAPNNLAVKFDGSGAHFSYADPGPDSPFDFRNGDAIMVEAWVNMEDIRSGENVYVVGKGRTHRPGFARDNQNWALRVREVAGLARASFLFATPPPTNAAAKPDTLWHRWTSELGFEPGSGWHHIAVSYKFGTPDSMHGWIDGQMTDGSWDMGGPTREEPVVDDDEIWVGSSLGGSPGNSFRGLLDEIAIHRAEFSDAVMRTRFRREGPAVATSVETPPALGDLPVGRVLVSLFEGLAAHERWPRMPTPLPPETMRWTADAFAFPRLPCRYDDWGIRDAWKAPVLLRAAADLKLTPGKHRFLLRARSTGRLWVNGTVVARTKPHAASTDGHEPVPPVSEPPLGGMRPVGYGDQEVFGDAEIGPDGRCRVILEAMVGGKKLRPEPGEMCVAVLDAEGKMYGVLAAAGTGVALTDVGWEKLASENASALVVLDDEHRRAAARSQDAFWAKRHAAARSWLDTQPGVESPVGENPVDAFVADRIRRAVAATAGGITPEGQFFHDKVLPVLDETCFRCHGDKEKGGLRLTSREAVLRGGKSGEAGVVPGDPDKGALVARLVSDDADDRMPPKGKPLDAAHIAAIRQWIASGAPWPAAPVAPEEVAVAPVVDDAAFLRRSWLDTLGIPPPSAEARAFLSSKSPTKRAELVDRLLADPRFADHWIGYWQDMLAENPNMLKPSLNNTGPFRWYLHEALRDNRPADRMVTELVMLRGGKSDGGTAGFGLAADNDAPFAAKGQVLGSAFLGLELQCARCHDSPYHSTKQRDLYALAAMFERKAVTVPKTSTVPAAFFERKTRESLIRVTLKPGELIAPEWPFADLCAGGAAVDALMADPKDTRERLAATITAPQNRRFAQVMVNRVWKRLIGAGLVEPAGDWENHPPSHPELLDVLAREFVRQGYDLKAVVRLVMTSELYQRAATGRNLKAAPGKRFFAAPERRRLAAEQVVDSLYAAAGKRMAVEELTFDPDARRPSDVMITLGVPRRAWQFASLSNERDRPSLALPRAQAVTDVLEAFGWTGARQSPRTDRETDPNVLQPGILANGTMSAWIVRLTADGELAQTAVSARSPGELVDEVFLRFLTRWPTAKERSMFERELAPGFPDRLRAEAAFSQPPPLPRLSKVTWSTHLVPEASQIKVEMERRARAGDPPDPRLSPAWRERFEDFVWAVINLPEFVWMP